MATQLRIKTPPKKVYFADRIGIVLEDVYEIPHDSSRPSGPSKCQWPSKKLFAAYVFDESDQEIANEYHLFRPLQLKKIEVDDGLVRKVP